MPINLSETMVRIKQAGASNVRAIPMSGQNAISGTYQIEIKDESGWVAIAEGLTKTLADQVIKEATNRLICG